MFNPFPNDFSLLSASLVLLIMAGTSFFFALLLRSKLRATQALPEDLSLQVFNKTFNVFDPYIGQRRIISNHIGPIVFIAVYGSWIAFAYIVFKTFEVGGVLGAIVFVICAFLLMIDETLELNKNARIFTKAINKGAGLAEGDMQVLHLMKKILPRLSAYHLVLASVFLASAFIVPFLVDAVFWTAAVIAAALFQVTAFTFKTSPLYSLAIMAAVFAAALVTSQRTINKVRKRIFGFPPPMSLEMSSLSLQMENLALYGRSKMHPRLHETDPMENEKIGGRDMEKHQ